MTSLPQFLTTAEIAEIVRVPMSTVRYWRHTGVGPRSFKVGRRVVYPRDAFEAWLAQQAGDETMAS